jgi:hypothetical protein
MDCLPFCKYRMTTEKQSEIIEKKNGGVRPGAGRPKGSIAKLSGQRILEAIEQVEGIPYEVTLANDFIAARYSDDKHLVAKYHQLILNKVVADKVDITTNGQSLPAPILTFVKSELPDYVDVDVKPA